MQDRRSESRIECTYPALARWRDPSSHRRTEKGIVFNFGARGMYLRVKHGFEPRVGLHTVICFALSAHSMGSSPENWVSLSGMQAPLVVARGQVVRTENHPDGTIGVGFRFERYRLIPAAGRIE